MSKTLTSQLIELVDNLLRNAEIDLENSTYENVNGQVLIEFEYKNSKVKAFIQSYEESLVYMYYFKFRNSHKISFAESLKDFIRDFLDFLNPEMNNIMG